MNLLTGIAVLDISDIKSRAERMVIFQRIRLLRSYALLPRFMACRSSAHMFRANQKVYVYQPNKDRGIGKQIMSLLQRFLSFRGDRIEEEEDLNESVMDMLRKQAETINKNTELLRKLEKNSARQCMQDKRHRFFNTSLRENPQKIKQILEQLDNLPKLEKLLSNLEQLPKLEKILEKLEIMQKPDATRNNVGESRLKYWPNSESLKHMGETSGLQIDLRTDATEQDGSLEHDLTAESVNDQSSNVSSQDDGEYSTTTFC